MNEEIKGRLEQIRRGELPDGYKRTTVKIAPESWNIKPLKEADRIQGVYPYYGASGIIDYVNDFIFDGEYILLGEDGANILDRSSPLAFRISGKCWVNNHAHVLQPRQGFDIDYLTNYLESLSYEKYNSGTAQPKLNQNVCGKIIITFPPLEEQRKIAAILSAQDSVIALKERLFAEKLRQKKYLMQQLLSGKQRLPGFHGRWNAHSLCDITERRTTRNIAQCDRVLTISGQYGLIEQWSFFDKTVASADKSNYFFLERDDFAYNKSRSTGYPFGAIKRLKKYDTGIVSPLYICFRISSQLVTAEYMEHYFEANLINQEIKFIAQEGARNHGLLNIGVDDFFNLKVYLPPVDEQMAIADILSAADREIELLRASLEQEKRKKKALSQLLLTGIVRV